MSTHEISRRRFLEDTGVAVGLAGAGLFSVTGPAASASQDQTKGAAGSGKRVAIVLDPDDQVAAAAPAQWAAGQLRDALTARGLPARLCQGMADVAAGESCVLAGSATSPRIKDLLGKSGVEAPSDPEALAIVAARLDQRPILLACGSDARGLSYALLELADRVVHTDQPLAGLDVPRPVVERPANPIRSVTRLFASDVEDKSWFHDKAFWPPYLTMLAAQRFNRFSLTLGLGYDFTNQVLDAYLHFAYPFLLAVPGYQVRATNFSDEERDKNLQMLRFISEESAKRGLHFQLGLWTHAYQWVDSPNVNHNIEGLTATTHAHYCREALRTLLQACPAISGVTFRIHGESGVAEQSYDFWKTVFEGVAKCGRKVEIDLHAKGIDEGTIDAALATGMPVTISPKFWAEHMGLPYHQASIRAQEMPPPDRKDDGFFSRSNGSRRFLRYGYGDLLAEDRRYGVLFRMWPGTQRVLLWGDPAMAAAYSRVSTFCGSLGMELFEPLSFKGRKGTGLPEGRTAYQDKALQPSADWEKYQYTYRLWGRLLYNPDSEPDTWRRYLRKQWGAGAEGGEAALAQASRILPLFTTAHLPSAANNSYWPEMYTNMSIPDPAAPNPYGDTPTPKRFGTVSPIDPALFATVDEHADALVKGLPSGKYSPLEVAQWLQYLSESARTNLAEATILVPGNGSPDFQRMSADVEVLIDLGLFFAAKLRAALHYALYDRIQDCAALQAALKEYRTARSAWDQLSRRTANLYIRDVTFGPGRYQRGHWQDRLPAIDQDIAKLEKLLEKPAQGERPLPEGDRERSKKALAMVLEPLRRPTIPLQHRSPASFRPGQDIMVELALGNVEEAAARPIFVRLHYRRVNQVDTFRSEDMRANGNRWTSSIPGTYTKSPFPLQYFFEMRDGRGQAWLYPGLGADLCGQPYYVIRQG